jgi:hypothetical protein
MASKINPKGVYKSNLKPKGPNPKGINPKGVYKSPAKPRVNPKGINPKGIGPNKGGINPGGIKNSGTKNLPAKVGNKLPVKTGSKLPSKPNTSVSKLKGPSKIDFGKVSKASKVAGKVGKFLGSTSGVLTTVGVMESALDAAVKPGSALNTKAKKDAAIAYAKKHKKDSLYDSVYNGVTGKYDNKKPAPKKSVGSVKGKAPDFTKNSTGALKLIGVDKTALESAIDSKKPVVKKPTVKKPTTTNKPTTNKPAPSSAYKATTMKDVRDKYGKKPSASSYKPTTMKDVRDKYGNKVPMDYKNNPANKDKKPAPKVTPKPAPKVEPKVTKTPTPEVKTAPKEELPTLPIKTAKEAMSALSIPEAKIILTKQAPNITPEQKKGLLGRLKDRLSKSKEDLPKMKKGGKKK